MATYHDRSPRSCVGFLETHRRTGVGMTLTLLVLSGVALGGVVGFLLSRIVQLLLGVFPSG